MPVNSLNPTVPGSIVLESSGTQARALSSAAGQAFSLLTFTMGTGGFRYLYAEVEFVYQASTAYPQHAGFGITKVGVPSSQWVGQSIDSVGLFAHGYTYKNGANVSILATTIATGGRGRVFVDLHTGSVWLGSDTVWSGNPAAGSGALANGLTGDWQIALNPYGNSNVNILGAKFHRFDWKYAPPKPSAVPLGAYQISGMAKLSNNDPAELVHVLSVTDQKSFSIIPETDGEYIAGVGEGEYIVVAEGPAGYRPLAHKVVVP